MSASKENKTQTPRSPRVEGVKVTISLGDHPSTEFTDGPPDIVRSGTKTIYKYTSSDGNETITKTFHDDGSIEVKLSGRKSYINTPGEGSNNVPISVTAKTTFTNHHTDMEKQKKPDESSGTSTNNKINK